MVKKKKWIKTKAMFLYKICTSVKPGQFGVACDSFISHEVFSNETWLWANAQPFPWQGMEINFFVMACHVWDILF